MTLQDRYLREQTLFNLYENPPYNDIEASLRLALDQSIQKINSTNGDWTRAKMSTISASLATELKKPYKTLLTDVQSDIKDQLNTTSLFKLDKDLISKIIDPDNLVQGRTMSELFKDQEAAHIRQMQVTFAAAAARGAGTDEIVKLLKDKNKTLTQNQLKSAVITTQHEARAKVRHENYATLEEQGLIEGYTYDATLDGRTTEYCRSHDGKTYWKPIKELTGMINVHFRCRSVFVPAIKDSKVRASVFGPTEQKTYGSWFKDQDDDFKKAVLGKNYESYKSGDFKVGGLSDLAATPMTLEAIKNLLYVPDIVYSSGDLNTNSVLVSQVVASDLAYPIRLLDPTLKVVTVGDSAFQLSIASEALDVKLKLDNTFKTSTIHKFILPMTLRNQGVSKTMMGKLFRTYETLQVKEVFIDAGLDNGAYTWLRYGFQPLNKEEFAIDMIKMFPNNIKVSSYLSKWKQGDFLALTRMLNDSELKELFKKKLSGYHVDAKFDINNTELLSYFKSYTSQ